MEKVSVLNLDFVFIYVLGIIVGSINSLPSGRILPESCKDLDPTDADVYCLSVSETKCLDYTRLAASQCHITRSTVLPGRAILGELPHMALIGYELDSGPVYTCGGTLISENYVLTSGYCLSFQPPSGFIVLLGELILNDDTDDAVTQKIKAAKTILHPRYNDEEVYNDIGLIKLAKPVKISVNVRPACLYSNESLQGVDLTASGWGLIPNTLQRNEHLRKLQLSEVLFSKCNNIYQRLDISAVKRGIDNATMICAADPLGNDVTCKGDDGGPLQFVTSAPKCTHQVVGVIGFGGPCKDHQEIPTVFTRVAPYVRWIEGIVWPETRPLCYNINSTIGANQRPSNDPYLLDPIAMPIAKPRRKPKRVKVY